MNISSIDKPIFEATKKIYEDNNNKSLVKTGSGEINDQLVLKFK
jgi:hypothetical protein